MRRLHCCSSGTLWQCDTARYIQIHYTAETIYQLSLSLLKSICNSASLRCLSYWLAGVPMVVTGFNEK